MIVLSALATHIICTVMFFLKKIATAMMETNSKIYALKNATMVGATNIAKAVLINTKTELISGKLSAVPNAKKDAQTAGGALVRSMTSSAGFLINRKIVLIAVKRITAMILAVIAQTLLLKENTKWKASVIRTVWMSAGTALIAIVRWRQLIAIGGVNLKELVMELVQRL